MVEMYKCNSYCFPLVIKKHTLFDCCTLNNVIEVNGEALGKVLDYLFTFQHFLLHLKSQRMKEKKKKKRSPI